MQEEVLKIQVQVDNEQLTGTVAGQVRGPRGLSAYEVAVALGFVGSEASWLESLKVKGDDGRTAYEVAVQDNGFVGSIEDWLESLVGPPVPLALVLGDDPNLAVSQKLLKDSIVAMESDNTTAVQEATRQAGIASTKAGEASSSESNAALSEAASLLYKDEALAQANIAGVKASEASDSEAEAWRQANLAAASASQTVSIIGSVEELDEAVLLTYANRASIDISITRNMVILTGVET